jgi:hypothetical protein
MSEDALDRACRAVVRAHGKRVGRTPKVVLEARKRLAKKQKLPKDKRA